MTQTANNGNGKLTITNAQSKLGRQNFLTGSRVGVVFTLDLDDTNVIDETDIQFLTEDASLAGTTGAVGGGYSQDARAKISKMLGTNKEIVVGAGIRSMSVEQRINVEQIGALGYFDIVETVEHSVASNTFTLEKMALRAMLLANIGLAPWGKDVLTSPLLNAYILDTKERQRGVNLGFVKLYGLHIETNRFSSSLGQTAAENVNFRVDRISRVKTLPTGLLAGLKKQFPTIYTGVEQLESYIIDR